MQRQLIPQVMLRQLLDTQPQCSGLCCTSCCHCSLHSGASIHRCTNHHLCGSCYHCSIHSGANLCSSCYHCLCCTSSHLRGSGYHSLHCADHAVNGLYCSSYDFCAFLHSHSFHILYDRDRSCSHHWSYPCSSTSTKAGTCTGHKATCQEESCQKEEGLLLECLIALSSHSITIYSIYNFVRPVSPVCEYFHR